MGGMTLNGYYGTHQNVQGLVGYNISITFLIIAKSQKKRISLYKEFCDFLLL